MKKILLILALFPLVAVADPSISTDAGRDRDSSTSSSIKRDKSLSQDKSRGNRESWSDSKEHAREMSRSRSHQERTSRTWEKSDSYSADININGLLMREFTARYERGGSGNGTAWDYFHTCRPLLNAVPDYPVRDYTNGGIRGRNDAMRNFAGNGFLIDRDGMPLVVDPSDRHISRYAQCRMTASYWVSEAGDRVTQQAVTSEAEVRERIRETFVEMDANEDLFTNLRQRARDIWADASCGNWLNDYSHYKSPEIDCGVFTFIGQTFTVENRETLSESSINGRSYKIAINASESDSNSIDDTDAADRSESYSARESDQRERYVEGKKTASLSVSKSKDKNSSEQKSRKSGASMSSTPIKD